MQKGKESQWQSARDHGECKVAPSLHQRTMLESAFGSNTLRPSDHTAKFMEQPLTDSST